MASYSDAADELFSPRIARLYARLRANMDRPQRDWRPESIVADQGVAARPLVIRRALAFARTLEVVPIEIDGDELIVGRAASDGAALRTLPPEFATPEEHAKARSEGHGITNRLSHKTPDYPSVPRRGLAALIDEVATKRAEAAARPDSPERQDSLGFLESIRIELQAVVAFAGRYADLAERLAESAAPDRAAELQEIAAICRQVPERPARTFHEAVQAVWLVHHAFGVTNSALSLGRLDQYLGPYLEADLAAGQIDESRAQEIADCLWLKFNDRASLRRDDQLARVKTREIEVGYRHRTLLATDQADALNHFGQNLLLGGIRPDGEDGTNRATYLFLDCLERFELTSPVVTVRLHRGSPQALFRRCAEVLKRGGGMPYIDNDDAIVTAYEKLGVPAEDARDYANSNCWETMIAGKSDQEIIRGINFLLILEWALNRGITRARGVQEGLDTGDPASFETFEMLLEAWKQQLDELVSRNVDFIGERYFACDLYHSSHGRYSYNPLLSALTKDCVERETDVIRGGARYVLWHMTAEGVANAIDALAAIRRLVYEERSVDLATVVAALAADWRGYEDLRQRMVHRAPKFANDDPAADALGREMVGWFVERTRHHARRYPRIIFPCSVGTFSWYASIGQECAASTDGRFAKEPVTPNFSPTLGMDLRGPTAAVKSYVQMSMSDLAAGAPLDLRLAAGALSGEAGTERLRAFIQAFVLLGGNMLTLTITDVAALRAAMAEPEKHRGLRVRMGGWSAYFVALSREQQELHVARVEHGLA